jgi:hypothetical protein
VVFTRANLVVRVASAGSEPVAVAPAVRHLDALLISAPGVVAAGATGAGLVLDAGDGRLGAHTAIDLPQAPDAFSAVHLRTDAGPFQRVEGRLLINLRHPGERTVTATIHRPGAAPLSAGAASITVGS